MYVYLCLFIRLLRLLLGCIQFIYIYIHPTNGIFTTSCFCVLFLWETTRSELWLIYAKIISYNVVEWSIYGIYVYVLTYMLHKVEPLCIRGHADQEYPKLGLFQSNSSGPQDATVWARCSSVPWRYTWCGNSRHILFHQTNLLPR